MGYLEEMLVRNGVIYRTPDGTNSYIEGSLLSNSLVVRNSQGWVTHRIERAANGVDLVVFRYNHDNKVGLRMNSDGDFQSRPFVQQFLAWASGDQAVEVEVEFKAPVEMWNVRPQRAKDGEAILGQLGAPLLYGVNGMYFPDWDLLLSWHGVSFSWKQPRVEKLDDGQYSAKMDVVLDESPLVVLVRPHYYHEHLGYEEHKPWKFRPNPKAVTGWCSWEAYHSDVSLGELEKTAQVLAPLRKYGLEYMQLDDGYQPPLIPAAKFLPAGPRITAHPPVIYSHPCSPTPSTTAEAPEFLTQNLSPATPAIYASPLVAP